MTENLVSAMQPEYRQQYLKLKENIQIIHIYQIFFIFISREVLTVFLVVLPNL